METLNQEIVKVLKIKDIHGKPSLLAYMDLQYFGLIVRGVAIVRKNGVISFYLPNKNVGSMIYPVVEYANDDVERIFAQAIVQAFQKHEQRLLETRILNNQGGKL